MYTLKIEQPFFCEGLQLMAQPRGSSEVIQQCERYPWQRRGTGVETCSVIERAIMSKPQDYEETCVTVRNVPYQCEDSNSMGRSLTGDVLGKGRVVWVKNLRKMKRQSLPTYSVSAYVEEIGIVSVDPRCLMLSSS